MKSIYVLLIALALFSVANQKFIGFGEFVEGHNSSDKLFRIVKSSQSNRFVQNNPVFLIVRSSTLNLEFETPCGTCRGPSGAYPTCVKKACNYSPDHDTIRKILFGSKDAAKTILASSTDPFSYKTGKDFLDLQRLK